MMRLCHLCLLISLLRYQCHVAVINGCTSTNATTSAELLLIKLRTIWKSVNVCKSYFRKSKGSTFYETPCIYHRTYGRPSLQISGLLLLCCTVETLVYQTKIRVVHESKYAVVAWQESICKDWLTRIDSQRSIDKDWLIRIDLQW